MKVATFILTCLIFWSCSFVARTVNNARESKLEDQSSIQKWLQKTDLTGYPIVTISPEAFLDTYVFFEYRKLIINKNGKVAELGTNKTGVVCHFTTPREIQQLEPDFPEFTEYLLSIRRTAKSVDDYKAGRFTEKIDTVFFNLDTLNEYVHTPEGKKTKIEATLETDYLVIIPFAKYYGRTMQTSDIKRYIKSIKENTKSNFQIILLNLDRQDWWDEESKKRIKLNI
jgi:hypothetical protein